MPVIYYPNLEKIYVKEVKVTFLGLILASPRVGSPQLLAVAFRGLCHDSCLTPSERESCPPDSQQEAIFLLSGEPHASQPASSFN